MAYDEELAERVRKVLGRRRGVREKKMFGGLAFMVNGHMACGVQGDDLMVRVGAEGYEEALKKAARGISVHETVKGDGPYPVRILTQPVIEGGRVTRLVQVGMSLESMINTRQRFLFIMAAVLPMGLLLAGGGGWLLVPGGGGAFGGNTGGFSHSLAVSAAPGGSGAPGGGFLLGALGVCFAGALSRGWGGRVEDGDVE